MGIRRGIATVLWAQIRALGGGIRAAWAGTVPDGPPLRFLLLKSAITGAGIAEELAPPRPE